MSIVDACPEATETQEERDNREVARQKEKERLARIKAASRDAQSEPVPLTRMFKKNGQPKIKNRILKKKTKKLAESLVKKK